MYTYPKAGRGRFVSLEDSKLVPNVRNMQAAATRMGQANVRDNPQDVSLGISLSDLFAFYFRGFVGIFTVGGTFALTVGGHYVFRNGTRLLQNRDPGDAPSPFSMFYIKGWAIFALALFARGNYVLTDEGNYLARVDEVNSYLSATMLETGGFTPTPNVVVPLSFPPSTIGLNIGEFFIYWVTTILAGTAIVALLWLPLRLLYTLVTEWATLFAGFQFMFVPSRHAQMYRDNTDQALGTPAPLKAFDLFAAVSAFSGRIRTRIDIIRAKNQAAKHARLKEKLQAQTQEINEETDLIRSASEREDTRLRNECIRGKTD